MLMTHPEFTDVRMYVVTKTRYTNSKGIPWLSLKVIWMHRKGWALSHTTRVKMPQTKFKEFKTI